MESGSHVLTTAHYPRIDRTDIGRPLPVSEDRIGVGAICDVRIICMLRQLTDTLAHGGSLADNL